MKLMKERVKKRREMNRIMTQPKHQKPTFTELQKRTMHKIQQSLNEIDRSSKVMLMRGYGGVIAGFTALVYGVNPLLVIMGVGFYEARVVMEYTLDMAY